MPSTQTVEVRVAFSVKLPQVSVNAEDLTTFELAIKAFVPLILVTTADPAHFEEVTRFLFPKRKISRLSSKELPLGNEKDGSGEFDPGRASNALKLDQGEVRWRVLAPPWTANRSKADEWAYRHFKKFNASLVVVNPHPSADLGPMWFDAGPLPTPWPMIHSGLQRWQILDEVIEEIRTVLGGLTIKEVEWLAALTQAKYHVISRATLADMRRAHFPERPGLVPVDTSLGFYVPEPALEKWLAVEAKFLLHEDVRLRPRGILLKGTPGTGKSLFAKRVANELKVPLYRMEMAGIKDKFVGQSERLLRHLLMSLDEVAPCAFLMDEIEKLFDSTQHHDSGVTSGLLASMLWWMAEHRSPVVTILTTNNISRIPPELYRPGRIDLDVELPGIPSESRLAFIGECAKSYDAIQLTAQICKDLDDELTESGEFNGYISQARLHETVRRAVKVHLLAEGK